MPKSREELDSEIGALTERANNLLQNAENEPSKVEEFKGIVENELRPQIARLTEERDRVEQREALESLRGEFGTLQQTLEGLRAPAQGAFVQPGAKAEPTDSEDPYAEGGSYFADVRAANRGNAAARERLTKGIESFEGKALTEEGKAMTEGVDAQGGYLVRPQIERRLVEAIEQDNVLRGLCSKLSIGTDSLQLDQLGLSTTAGWVAELATKPETTAVSLATITVNVHTAAGLATISNQLLADSNPAVDRLAVDDLRKRLVAVEETAFLTGTGTNQPLGILNTPGLGATALTSTDIVNTGGTGLLDRILDAIATVEDGHGAPTAILMHPRTWTRIIKSKDADGKYLITADDTVQDPRTTNRGPVKTLFGVRVVLSNRIPTNLGAGTNESRVIVGDFGEALILDRQGITVDESPHVYFTTNQTVFRAEERVGFTAARTPAAFNVIGGAGLAGG
jgi:HK97 family phage major capsid protein